MFIAIMLGGLLLGYCLSGGSVDRVGGFGGDAPTGYVLVFILEALLLLLALGLLSRLHITKARVISSPEV